MKEDNMEFLLDDKKLKKAYKKARMLTIIRTVIIVILVTIPLYIAFIKINTRITYRIGAEYYDEKKKLLKLTNPHAYISNANDIIGFLGASGHYTVSKEIGIKSVELYDENSQYGFIPYMQQNHVLMFEGRGGIHKTGEWPVNLDKSGNLTMMLFHPDITYKEYKDDLGLLSKVSPDSLLEMTLSLDKKYKASEIMKILPNANISEVLIDGYTEDEMNRYKEEASKNYSRSTFIREFDFIRLAVSQTFQYDPVADMSEQYKQFLNDLQYNFKDTFYKDRFRTIYSTLKAKSQLEGDKADIIGVIVYGSPEELQRLKTNSHIKASSVGIVTRNIIFK